MEAYSKSSETDATNKKPVIARKAAAKTYAMGDAKYVRISLRAIIDMNFINLLILLL